MLETLKRNALLAVMKTGAYRWALLDLLPRLRLSNDVSELYGWKYQELYQALEPGDILLAIDRHHVASRLIEGLTGGSVSHAAFCVGKGGPWEVSEMTQRDYTQSTFYDVCRHADRVVVATCKDFDPAYKQAMIARCKSLVGTRYDTQFTLGVELLSCSELVYFADFERRLSLDLSDVAGIGRPYISPQGLLEAKNLVVKCDSDRLVAPPGLNLPAPGRVGLPEAA